MLPLVIINARNTTCSLVISRLNVTVALTENIVVAFMNCLKGSADHLVIVLDLTILRSGTGLLVQMFAKETS